MTITNLKYVKIPFFALLTAGLLLSCSEERKREAAKLQEELMAQSDSVRDTTSSAVAAPSSLKEQLAVVQASLPEHQAAEEGEIAIDSNSEQEESPVAENAMEQVKETTLTAVMEQPSMAPATEPIGPYYTIQVESWESLPYAEQQVTKYRSDGYSAFLSSVVVGDRTKHRVRVGTYVTRDEAVQAMAEIAQKYGSQPWVDFVK